ncbi:MAG: hypothetical protein ACRCZP_17450 [Phycicoccus sp.]
MSERVLCDGSGLIRIPDPDGGWDTTCPGCSRCTVPAGTYTPAVRAWIAEQARTVQARRAVTPLRFRLH